MTRATVWVVVAVLLSASAARSDDSQRAMLPVTVNQIAQGEVLSIISGDDVLIPKSFLEALGIPVLAAATRMVEGESFVSLRALSPQAVFTLNPDDLTLSITLDPHLLGHKIMQLGRGESRVDDRGGDPTAFFNYALTGDKSTTPAFFGELGMGRANTLFYSGFSRNAGEFRRGMTYVNVDSPRNLTRWTFGDAIVGGDPIGGTLPIGGVTFAREFTLQPYMLRSPSVDATGTATTPSTVEVYVNGQLTNRINVEPGVFTLHDLPVTGGLGSTQLVVRDVFGRETVQQSSFYYSTAALRKGLSDFVFSAGAIRNDVGRSFDYGRAVALAQYRLGVTDRVTLGGRAEVSERLVSGGPRATFGTPVGEIDVEASVSRAGTHSGSAGLAAYRFTSTRVSFGFAATQRSNDYATLSLRPEDERVTRDVNVFVASSFGRVSVGLAGSLNDTRDGERFRRIGLQASAPLSRFGSAFATLGTVEHANKREPEVMAGVTLSLGHLTTANVLFQKSEGTEGTHLEVRRPLSQANGYGYALQRDSSTGSENAALQYQTSFGRYEVNIDPKNASQASYSAAGGLVYLGGALLPARPVQNSYALARVGVPGVKIFASNQEVGRTNRFGDLLISNLLPHYANELRLADKDLPMDYQVDESQITVVPPSRGGVLAKFPVRQIRSYTGRMRFMIVGETYTPSMGEVSVQRKGGEPQVLSLGRDGEFYVEDLDPGTYEASLRIGSVGCRFRLTLPSSSVAVTDLGVIPCAP